MAIPGDFDDESPDNVTRLVDSPPGDAEAAQFVLCMPADQIPPLPAVERPCGKCSTLVWVSHPLVPLVDQQGAVPMCPHCAIDRLTDPDSDTEFQVASAQTSQLAQLGILGQADWFVTAMNRLQRDKGSRQAAEAIGRLVRQVAQPDPGPVTSGGVSLSPELIERLVTEAEAGYDITRIRPRRDR